MSEGTIRMFPVLWEYDRAYNARLSAAGCPKQVPWSFVASHAVQCQHNHDQSPERLAERGGLSPCEMVAVVKDRRWFAMSPEDAVEQLLKMLAHERLGM